IQTARNGIAVLANTPHTIEDIVQYVGVQRQKAILVPHLAQLEHGNDPRSAYEKGDYFIWTTNAGEHKNQLRTLQALTRYYEVNGGSLDCHVTGVESSIFDPNNKEGETDSKAHIKAAREYILERPNLAARLIFHGDLPHAEYI
ncbi:hypothetical protein, partial [Lactobacillus crispatus]|uniref:hypothetical protein n=1 Tax=Lactobacillus crispatus TaxID=47770 RepID=UPI0010DCF355